MGAITGVVGALQALEAVKILAGLVPQTRGKGKGKKDANVSAEPQQQQQQQQAPLSSSSLSFSPLLAASSNLSSLSSRLLLFDGSSSSFRSVRLRGRDKTCAMCGDNPSITRETLEQRGMDYQRFCGSANHDGFVPAAASTAATAAAAGAVQAKGKVPTVSVTQMHEAFNPSPNTSSSSSSSPPQPLLIDVREPVQFRICALPGAVNVPLRVLKQGTPLWLQRLLRPAGGSTEVGDATASGNAVQSITPHPSAAAAAADSSAPSSSPLREIFVMCRRGVDSVTATRLLLAQAQPTDAATASSANATIAAPLSIRHVSGGLQAWHDQVDASFPLY